MYFSLCLLCEPVYLIVKEDDAENECKIGFGRNVLLILCKLNTFLTKSTVDTLRTKCSHFVIELQLNGYNTSV